MQQPRLAQQLFAADMNIIRNTSIGATIDKMMANLAYGDVTLDVLASHKAKIMKLVVARHGEPLGERKVAVSFMNMRVQIKVDSLEDEVLVRLWAFIKERAHPDQVPVAFFEAFFGVGRVLLPKVVFSDPLVVPVRACRDFLAEQCAGGEPSTLVALVRQLATVLRDKDPMWRVEAAAVEFIASDGCEAFVQEHCLDQLPNSNKQCDKTMWDYAKIFAGLLASPWTACLTKKAKRPIEILEQLFTNACKGVAPTMHLWEQDKFLKEVIKKQNKNQQSINNNPKK